MQELKKLSAGEKSMIHQVIVICKLFNSRKVTLHGQKVEDMVEIVNDANKVQQPCHLFSDSDKTHGTDDHCDSTGNSNEHKPPSRSYKDKSKFDKQALEVELLEFQKICQFRVMDMTESEDLNFIFGEGTFDQIAIKVREYCPLLTKIVETLAVGKWSKYNKYKKTVSYKFKTALQMVLALDDIKSPRTTTAFSTLFGLLLISYGAGKVVLQTLEPFGLCKSYDF